MLTAESEFSIEVFPTAMTEKCRKFMKDKKKQKKNEHNYQSSPQAFMA